jgi:Cof subfamily protein (haloacid dehalogenase superfamily)
MTPRWIVYVDLDGTLLNSRFTVSDRARAAFSAAELFAHVVLASGRPVASCMRIASDLLQTPRVVIALNGGTVVDCETLRFLQVARFQPGIAAAVASVACSASVALCVHHPLRWYVSENDATLVREVARSGSEPTVVRRLEEYLDQAVKLMLIGHPDVIRGLRPTIESVGAVTAFTTYPEYLEVMPATFNKGTGARVARDFLCGEGGVHTVAVGDGVADLPLFAFADEAVAMGNAPEEVQRAAAYVAPSNDDDGAALAIEAIVLGNDDSRALLVNTRRSWQSRIVEKNPLAPTAQTPYPSEQE